MRHKLLLFVLAAILLFAETCAVVDGTTLSAAEQAPRLPNFVIIFCDDLGYGDLGCYGHPTIRTPHLDQMASEGMKFTQFYAAAPVCTPSRAALLTGRLPIRNGMCSDKRRVLFPNSKGGLPPEEITIAEGLRGQGYATACVGKWHLGHLPQFLPTKQGFQSYFGIPYSNDMDRVADAPQGRDAFLDPKSSYWNVPILRNEKTIERPADQNTLTQRYGDEAVKFIREHKTKPFFLYLAHSMPHLPLFASDKFRGQSKRGLYGDVVEELDASVGKILTAIRDEKLAENTLVFFTSDNGPWLVHGDQGGSAGLLREGKGSTWEGGMREPALAWQPGKIRAGSVATDLSSTLDLFATLHALAEVPLPKDRELDSFDLSPVLYGSGPARRDRFYYYRDNHLTAIRKGPWKLHVLTQNGYGQPEPVRHDPPILFQLEVDPSEKNNVAAKNPAVVAELLADLKAHAESVKPAPSQLE